MQIFCAAGQIPWGRHSRRRGPGISAFKASLVILTTNHMRKIHFSVVVLYLLRVISPFEMLRRLSWSWSGKKHLTGPTLKDSLDTSVCLWSTPNSQCLVCIWKDTTFILLLQCRALELFPSHFSGLRGWGPLQDPECLRLFAGKWLQKGVPDSQDKRSLLSETQ